MAIIPTADHVWMLNQTSGTTLIDQVGNEDIPISGNPLWEPDSTLRFDGNGDYCLASDDLGIGLTSEVAFGGFFQPIYTKLQFIAGLQDPGQSRRYRFAIAIYDPDRIAFFFDGTNADETSIKNYNDIFLSGQENHIICNVNYATQTVDVYRNGVFQTQTSDYIVWGSQIYDGAVWCFGRDQGDLARDYEGPLRDWRIYKRFLTPQEIADWYDNAINPPDPSPKSNPLLFGQDF